jgi:hypothetical protein
MAENTSNGTVFQINFVNNSTNPGTFMVFQQDPNLGMKDVLSLAWMTQYANPNTNGYFRWSVSFDFVWKQNKAISSEITAGTSQFAPADPMGNNGIVLTYDGQYSFIDPSASAPPGSLQITQDQTIPLKQASVGIGMSGAGTFLVPTEPNMNLLFTPNPEYWIAFGNFIQGAVLDIQEITKAALVTFGPGITEVTATLNVDDTWTINPA